MTVQKMIILAINASNIFLMTPYLLNKDGSFGLSKPRLWLAWVITLATTLGLGGKFYQNLNFKQLTQNPYLLLAACRNLYYSFFALISVILMNARHTRIINILNKLREVDKAIKFNEKDLKMISVKLCIQLFGFYCAAILFAILILMLNPLLTFLGCLLTISLMYIIFVASLIEVLNLYLIYLFGLYIELIHQKLLFLTGPDENIDKLQKM